MLNDKKTKAFFEDFKGHPVIALWEVDPAGNKVGQYPVISLGVRKAKVLLSHIEELKRFAADRKD